MTTPRAVIERLLGSRRDECPLWPPDVFGVAATIVESAGLYAAVRYAGKRGDGYFGKRYLRRVHDAGSTWRRDVTVPREVQRAWARLAASNHALTDLARLRAPQAVAVADAAMFVLCTADEASAGIGFVPVDDEYKFANFHLVASWQAARDRRRLLPNAPHSLCLEIAPSRLCVQPKSRTPQVGCTLRSLTHHLALLPRIGVIRTTWNQSVSRERQVGALNLLLVPFPYRIDSSAFVAGDAIDDESTSAHLVIAQDWCARTSPARLFAFLRDLIAIANREAGPVHGVILPELALPRAWARQIAGRLVRLNGIELFVTGVLVAGKPFPRNCAYAALSYGQGQFIEWCQSKHHRWLLERLQIGRYGLAHRLSPSTRYWEGIDISDRELHFYVARPGASIAVLVCEDLARIEPIQPAIRAVGPSLVIALLMDGPQEERRWPGRYATVLADDPGSSVLSLTSLGMARRSVQAQGRTVPVALWKDPTGLTREFCVAPSAHALLLGIDTAGEENWTLDGRSDKGSTVQFSFRSVHEITHPRPPAWV